MFKFAVLILCFQTCLIQTAMSKSCECNSYGGTGTGQVGVSGNIDACGTTCVDGSVPVLGSVCFGGCAPTSGSVSISGQCGCGCQSEQTLLSSASTYIPSGSSNANAVAAGQQSARITPIISQSSRISKTSPSFSSACACQNARLGQSAPSIRQKSPSSASISQNTPSFSLSKNAVSKPRASLSKPIASLSKPSISLNSGSGYRGTGTGQAAVSIDIDACSATCVEGAVPVIGSAGFSGGSRSSLSKPSISLNSGSGYRGTGTGQVSVSGDIDACGATCVEGVAPVRGSVGFSGSSRASLSKPSISLNSGSGYRGTGTGQVSVSGDIDACGATCVEGVAPVRGSVGFSGSSRASLSKPRASVRKPSISLNSGSGYRSTGTGQVGVSGDIDVCGATCVEGAVRGSVGFSGSSRASLSKPSISLDSGAGYGGSGTGQAGVSGDFDACGVTCVEGAVPVLGSVEFSGCSPICGTVTINGKCECDCN
ncbi:uncharacterized protein LOC134752829 [Cydia strobilella]|uniref:uncharacterized protein LOC134752829 n=1 Tax=Cydia strobilella TaxID=1100964 RepID=UPI003005900C